MQVYYFTRSGRSEKIAKELASRYKTDANKINDNKNWNGAINFLKAGAKASKKEKTEIDYKKPDGEIILIFPVWAGNLPPAVRSFVENYDKSKIIAIPTSLGTTLRERDGFLKVIDLVGKEIIAPSDEQIL